MAVEEDDVSITKLPLDHIIHHQRELDSLVGKSVETLDASAPDDTVDLALRDKILEVGVVPLLDEFAFGELFSHDPRDAEIVHLQHDSATDDHRAGGEVGTLAGNVGLNATVLALKTAPEALVRTTTG